MVLIGAVVVAVLLLGYGVGSAVAVAVVACGVMLGAIFWFLRRSEQRAQTPDNSREDLPRH